MEAFSDWLKTQTHRWDPIGVLAREVKEDARWPKGETFDTCLTHLKKSTDPQVLNFRINALIEAWSNYSIILKCTPPGKHCKTCGKPIYTGISADQDECDACVDDGPSIFVVGLPIASFGGTVCESCLTRDERAMLGNDDIEVWREGTGGWTGQPPNCERCGKKFLVELLEEDDGSSGEEAPTGH
jgi:hypothetical protein